MWRYCWRASCFFGCGGVRSPAVGFPTGSPRAADEPPRPAQPPPIGRRTPPATSRGSEPLMAARRRRRLKKRTHQQMQGWGALAAAAVVVWAAANWSTVWPVLAAVLGVAVVGGAGGGLWRAHRRAADAD